MRLLLLVLNLLGVDVRGWLTHLWDQLKAVPVGYLVAGVLLQVAQTTFNGVAYYGILRYAYPNAGVTLWPIVTAYAVGVGMNSFLPANIGTFVTLLMFVAIIPGSSFAGIFAAYVVNKIFFTVVGAVVYGLLFLQAGAAFDVELGWFRHHALLALLIIVGGAFLIFFLGRMFWHKLKGLWEKAEQGGKILTDPKAYVTRVLTWQVLSYAAKLGVIVVFLAAYSIPVTFGSVVHVIGSSSAANVTSVTPGSRWRHSGSQRGRVARLHRRRNSDRLFAEPAARDLRHQRRLRARARPPHLRLDGRQGSRLDVLQRREGEGAQTETRRTRGNGRGRGCVMRASVFEGRPRRRRMGDQHGGVDAARLDSAGFLDRELGERPCSGGGARVC